MSMLPFLLQVEGEREEVDAPPLAAPPLPPQSKLDERVQVCGYREGGHYLCWSPRGKGDLADQKLLIPVAFRGSASLAR